MFDWSDVLWLSLGFFLLGFGLGGLHGYKRGCITTHRIYGNWL